MPSMGRSQDRLGAPKALTQAPGGRDRPICSRRGAQRQPRVTEGSVDMQSLQQAAQLGLRAFSTSAAAQAAPAVASKRGFLAQLFGGSGSRVQTPLTDALAGVEIPDAIPPAKDAPATQLTKLSNGFTVASEATPVSGAWGGARGAGSRCGRAMGRARSRVPASAAAAAAAGRHRHPRHLRRLRLRV